MSKFFSTIRSEHFIPASKYLRPVQKKIHRDVGSNSFVKGDEDNSGSNIIFSNISSEFSGDVSNNSDFSEIQKDENIITIKNNKGEEYELNKISFINSIKEYVQYSNTQINELPKELSESFKTIVETLKTIHSNPVPYKIILSEIKQIFIDNNDSDDTSIIPGTIKSFFVGCISKQEKSRCDPSCTSSLPPDSDSHSENTDCEHHVLIYENGKFTSLNAKKSNTAYIYMKGDIKPLSLSQKNILLDSGIKTIFLIKQKGKDNIVINTNINELEKHIEIEKENKNDNSDDNTQTVVIIILSVLIVLLILCFFIFFRK